MTTNTRYWLFGGAVHYASGGMYDAMARFGSLNDAIAHAKAWEDPRRGREWWHVVDTVTGELVAESDCRPYGAPERKAKR